MPPKSKAKPTGLYKFHRGSRLPKLETRSQKAHRKKCQERTAAEVSNKSTTSFPVPASQPIPDPSPPSPGNYDDPNDQVDTMQDDNVWNDIPDELRPEDVESLKQIRSHHRALIEQQKLRNWNDLMESMFPAYLHLKKKTQNWTNSDFFKDLSKDLCKCQSHQMKSREVDLIDLIGQKRVKMPFCTCIPDPIHFLAHGYLPSTPLFPQTGFSLRLLNFYDLLWNICNANLTSFSEVLRRWNESMSVRLCIKETKKPRDLRRCLSGSVDAYRHLKRLEQDLIHTATSLTPQDVLAQRSCPACFGTSAPALDESQPKDTNQIFICLDGNFQHRHHEKASKNHLPLHTPHLFISPEEIKATDDEILTHEQAQKKTQKAKDRCSEQHKAADDRRNASTWKGCDDTGLFGCCCRHDSVIYFCNIYKSGEGRGLPMSIIKRLLGELNPTTQIGILYDIGCTLGKFFQSRKLLTEQLPRMKFATAVFHSYVHDWPCQIQFNPRYNKGWGLTDGEGLERLWSYLSPLVGPQRYATRNHRLGGINHRSVFHNYLGIEKLRMCGFSQ
ncbi:uncharacterized protein PGTG_12256 [Puccinia graminis f. sp. tritici CRL 75-36-700-3]|uniref:CxC1-like cysteine cluster associated with KDZ transposases domain-containing protein n=1 Tax=Puccinia graminis f. sp. tritici (strain CRL 75-36-700-3 / race SCCL) TaxID=418459 RepID=E3KPR5_PUCGT|nr:uncharacterized protein PGTG_12256 [Puccinia graminis f. sp. tritici CRL 75-36-700-3]EFP86300.2 hypothetical protein PGTG_12256 [Puccinia graminis f. sp. tritici CRL 75-36-700-3]